MPDANRVVCVEMNATFLGFLIRGRRDVALTSDWPDDATILHASYDEDKRSINVFVASDTFDPVPTGNIVPRWNPTITAHAHTDSELGTLLDLFTQEKGRMVDGGRS